MQLSLTRLRAAFVALGAVLLLALGLFVRSAFAHLSNQRRLRHEVVAERIFDELERELTAHLALESARPSEAYDAKTTNIGLWAPFVVGYFTVSDRYQVVARDQLDERRRARVERALTGLWPAPSTPVPQPAQQPSTRVASSSKPAQANPAAAVQAPLPAKSTSPDVLRRLNRAPEERARQMRNQRQQNAQELDPYGEPFAY